MNNSPNQQGANQATNKPRGLIAGAIGLLIELVIWLCAALMFNILVELVGIFFKYWSIPGAAHSASMINVEIAWLNRDFSNVFGSPAKTSVEFARSFYDAVFVWMGYDLLATLKASSSTAIYSAYFEATANMVYLFGVRLIVIVFSFPVFLFLGQSL